MTTYNMTGKELYDALASGQAVPVANRTVNAGIEYANVSYFVIEGQHNIELDQYLFNTITTVEGSSILTLYATGPDEKVTDVQPEGGESKE